MADNAACSRGMTMTMMEQTDPDRPARQRGAKAAAPSVPVDLAHLRRFTAGNRVLEREVLDLFVEQAPRTLQAMQLANSEKTWLDAAHTLKGSAFAVGANVIARTAAEAELVRGEPQRWPEILSRLEQAICDARSFITIAA